MSRNWLSWFQNYRIFHNISNLNSDIKQVKVKIDEMSRFDKEQEEFYRMISQSIQELKDYANKVNDTDWHERVNESLKIMQDQLIENKMIGSANKEIFARQNQELREEIKSFRRDLIVIQESNHTDLMNGYSELRGAINTMRDDLREYTTKIQNDNDTVVQSIESSKESVIDNEDLSNKIKNITKRHKRQSRFSSFFDSIIAIFLLFILPFGTVFILHFCDLRFETLEGYISSLKVSFNKGTLTETFTHLYEMFTSGTDTKEATELEMHNKVHTLFNDDQTLIDKDSMELESSESKIEK